LIVCKFWPSGTGFNGFVGYLCVLSASGLTPAGAGRFGGGGRRCRFSHAHHLPSASPRTHSRQPNRFTPPAGQIR
jgi:hypothetical protein